MYKEEHRLEKQREATRRYRAQNPEAKAKSAAYYQYKKETDPGFVEKRREATRRRRANNSEVCKETNRRADLKRYHVSKKEAYEILGNKCAVCGYSNQEVLQIDHIVAIGDAERKRLNHYGRTLYKLVIDTPQDFQLLCPTHNWEKRVENKEGNKGGVRRRQKVIVETDNSVLV